MIRSILIRADKRGMANSNWKKLTRLQIEKLAPVLEKRGWVSPVSEVRFHSNFIDDAKQEHGEALEFRMSLFRLADGRNLLLRGWILMNEDSIEVLDP